MEITISVIIASIVLLLIVTPLLFFLRRSTDVRLENDLLVLRYPFRKEEIKLTDELKSWHLQEAYFLRWGKMYAINMELKSGKWRSVSSRFNPDSFKILLDYLDQGFGKMRRADSK